MSEIQKKENSMASISFSDKQIQLLKDTYCKNSTDDEFDLFIYVCKKCGLDPFMKQIHPVKRWNSDVGKNVMTFQTGIDGYRLMAERTGKYMPGRESTFVYENGKVFSATAYVKKLGPDGVWHEISATAHFSEYVGKKKDGTTVIMWLDKPHIMLGKCAEALALRKAFPADLSGIYTKEEMEQADNPDIVTAYISNFQSDIIRDLIDQSSQPKLLLDKILNKLKCESLNDIPLLKFEPIVKWVQETIKEQQQEPKGIEISPVEVENG